MLAALPSPFVISPFFSNHAQLYFSTAIRFSISPGSVSFDSINFAVPTNKFFARLLERSQWSQLKLHSSEMVLTRNFSKQQ